MKLGDKIKATYITGGGEEKEEGNFVIEKLTKTFMFLKMLEEGFFCQDEYWKIRKIPLRDFKNRKEPMPEWTDDKTFTCYHKQSGTPTIYEIV